jgi:predicted Rossmann fold flavoprotein
MGIFLNQLDDLQMTSKNVAIIGGGAAGYFAAIHIAESNPKNRVVLFEATQKPLAKVLISGGGRCNVTHHCFEPAELIKAYPRGNRELRSAFSRFQPRDTVAWYNERGVELKVEDDGRMFPITDNSSTIAECLKKAASDAGVEVRLGAIVKSISRNEVNDFVLTLRESQEEFRAVVITSGSSPAGHELIRGLGHTIVSPVPSLFTFNIKDSRISELPGIAFEQVKLNLKFADRTKSFDQAGPLLITHWGLSGPAVLKLSAWAARELFETKYQAELRVNFAPDYNTESFADALTKFKDQHPKKMISNDCPVNLTKRFWKSLVTHCEILETETWANLPKAKLRKLATEVTCGVYQVTGKGVFKDEFVTCGGVALDEVDFRSMESRVCAGLFFAGEVLDIDGITGGFNFQNAWTTAFIASGGVSQRLSGATNA